MKKEYDVIALGEVLIDFTEVKGPSNGQKLFEQNPGGAPPNFLTVASHMGHKTAFIGKVGTDMHGAFLKRTLQNEGIDVQGLIEDARVFTTLAFVEIDASGERHFSFARKPGADTMLQREELPHTMLESCKVFHYGSLSLTDEPARSATLAAIEMAKAAGACISYDPNYRSSLWENEGVAVERMRDAMQYANVMKVSDEESILLTGCDTVEAAGQALLEMGPELIAITLGAEGVLVVRKDATKRVPGFRVKPVDTTGAGDSFWGGFISCFLSLEKEVADMTWEDIEQCAITGNAVAALCVQGRGGIPSIPTLKQVQTFLQEV